MDDKDYQTQFIEHCRVFARKSVRVEVNEPIRVLPTPEALAAHSLGGWSLLMLNYGTQKVELENSKKERVLEFFYIIL